MIKKNINNIFSLLNESEGFLKEKEYKVAYVIKNPPAYAKKNPETWEQAFYEYLRRQGVKKPEKLKTVDNIEWNEVVRIYNTLIGKKNRDRKAGFVKKKNTDLKVASKKYSEANSNKILKGKVRYFDPKEMKGIIDRNGVFWDIQLNPFDKKHKEWASKIKEKMPIKFKWDGDPDYNMAVIGDYSFK